MDDKEKIKDRIIKICNGDSEDELSDIIDILEHQEEYQKVLDEMQK